MKTIVSQTTNANSFSLTNFSSRRFQRTRNLNLKNKPATKRD